MPNKFKVGDEVRITEKNEKARWKEGVISEISIDDDFNLKYKVMVVNKGYAFVFWECESNLELLKEKDNGK